MPDKTQSRDVQYYNLDVIISVGYRVKSHQGTQFRIWATQRLKEWYRSLIVDTKTIMLRNAAGRIGFRKLPTKGSPVFSEGAANNRMPAPIR